MNVFWFFKGIIMDNPRQKVYFCMLFSIASIFTILWLLTLETLSSNNIYTFPGFELTIIVYLDE